MRRIGRNVFVVLACTVFVALYLVVLAQLFGRVFGISILFAEDASSILFIWFVMSGAVVAYQLRDHLEVNLLHEHLAPRLSPGANRAWTLFVHLAQLLFLGVFSWGLVVMARKTWAASYGSLTEFRFGYLYVGVLVCALAAIALVLRTLFVELRRGDGAGE